MTPHDYVNPFVQCHPGNPNCIPMEGRCKICGQPKAALIHGKEAP